MFALELQKSTAPCESSYVFSPPQVQRKLYSYVLGRRMRKSLTLGTTGDINLLACIVLMGHAQLDQGVLAN